MSEQAAGTDSIRKFIADLQGDHRYHPKYVAKSYTVDGPKLLAVIDALQAQLETAREGRLVADFIDSVFSNSYGIEDYPAREWLIHQWRGFFDAQIGAYSASPSTPDAQRQRDLALVRFAWINSAGDDSPEEILSTFYSDETMKDAFLTSGEKNG